MLSIPILIRILPEEPIYLLYFQRIPCKTRQLSCHVCAVAQIWNYPSLPKFTHPWTAESPQFPPNASRNARARAGVPAEPGAATGGPPHSGATWANCVRRARELPRIPNVADSASFTSLQFLRVLSRDSTGCRFVWRGACRSGDYLSITHVAEPMRAAPDSNLQ
jgi:hypothetical protein